MRSQAVVPALLLAALSLSLATPAAAAVEYVIITREAIASEFQRLADWRAAHGLAAEVVTVEWIEASYPGGVDAAERVRLFIQDAYHDQGTLFVLLGGDAEIVPVRYARIDFAGQEFILTDYYFMCLDGTWNADGDAFFGEVEDDVDLFPEVFAGRAPVSSPGEARVFVDKTLAYEAGAAGASYPASALFLAERLFASLHGAEIAEPAIAVLPSWFTVERLYEESENWPGSLPLSRAAAIEAIDRGFGLVYHIGHASETTWSLGSEVLTVADVDQLTNGPRTSVVFDFGGPTAAFDFDEAIGERWLVNPEGGAVAYVGSTEHGFVAASRDLQTEWFHLVFEESVRALGMATALARLPLVGEAQVAGAVRFTLLALELLGDPALELRVVPGTAGVAGAQVAPAAVALEAVPNPFHAGTGTRIAFDLPGRGEMTGRVELGIYDAAGRLVRTLVAGPVAPGRHAVAWDGRTARGAAPAGVYFVRLTAGGSTGVRKLAIAR